MNDEELHVQAILRSARSWLNTPYMHQASCKHVGCDCLGLVRGVWREVMGAEPEPVPPYSSAWSEVDPAEKLLAVARRHFQKIASGSQAPGDVLIFRLRRNSAAKHAGILSGPQHFIHAYDGTCVVESVLSEFWQRCIAGVFRFPLIEKVVR